MDTITEVKWSIWKVTKKFLGYLLKWAHLVIQGVHLHLEKMELLFYFLLQKKTEGLHSLHSWLPWFFHPGVPKCCWFSLVSAWFQGCLLPSACGPFLNVVAETIEILKQAFFNQEKTSYHLLWKCETFPFVILAALDWALILELAQFCP